jgi:hypothetical protein
MLHKRMEYPDPVIPKSPRFHQRGEGSRVDRPEVFLVGYAWPSSCVLPSVDLSFLLRQESPMHRFIARALLVLLLVGTFAPLALAVSAQPPHACCMRKMHEYPSPHQAEFNAPYCCHHDCCRSVVSSQFAQVPSVVAVLAAPTPTRLQSDLNPAFGSSGPNSSRSVRGPPLC